VQAAAYKCDIAPIFEAISTRSSQNLNAEYFALMIIDPTRMSCGLFINKETEIGVDLKKQLQEEAPKAWLNCRQNEFKPCYSDGKNKCNNPICEIFTTDLSCTQVLSMPFESDDLGGGILIWGWRRTPLDFSENYIDKAKLIAEQIKLSLKLSLNEQKGQELNAKLAALLELSTAIYSSLNYTDVLEKAVHLSRKIIGADGGSIFILDKKSNILKPLITVDHNHEAEISRVVLKLGEGITGRVAQSGVGIISNHSENDPRAFQVPGTPEEPESIISAPLTWSGEVIGAITLRSAEGRQFSQDDLDILTIFARQTADAIENAKLFESLERAYKELSSTQEQLVMTEKLRALGEMAGGVAHDFNNVLGTILGRIQLLLQEVEDSRWIDNLKQIERVTLAGAKTVQKLQNFTRISNQGQFEHVNLETVILDAIEATRPRWKDECQCQGINIDLSFECDEIQSILGNKTDLVEAISNLILNAVDAINSNGQIKIRAFTDDGKTVVKISDNGIGMTDDVLNRVFYPFFTTKGIKSNGMGLAVVYGIISRHKSEIDISSIPGQGTVCTLMFPASGPVKPKIEQLPEVIKEVKANILVIDDDENILDVIEDMLEYLNHNVTTAGSGEEGLNKFKANSYDLVITDLGMPGISGWDVTRMCKSIKPGIPVLMISGWGNQIDDDMIAESGLDGVMAKPFEIDKIKATIQNILAKKAAVPADSPADKE
jgi:signal transduction histidine kinase/ActR/RegA family two-component response regulator